MKLEEYLKGKKPYIYKVSDIKSADGCKAYAIKEWFDNNDGCVWIAQNNNFLTKKTKPVSDNEISKYYDVEVVILK